MSQTKTSDTPAWQTPVNPLHPSMHGRLDPHFIDFYNTHLANIPAGPIDLPLLRTTYSGLYSCAQGPTPSVGRIYDSTIPVPTTVAVTDTIDIACRVYEPTSPGPWPVHIDFHGGGWALGDLDTEAQILKHICATANVVVIDIAYRLLPEHAFPTAIHDSLAAVHYIHQHGAQRFHIIPTSISLGGVSAGGNIALICAHGARDANIPLRVVVVGTPTVDDLSQYTSAAESPYSSMQENEFAPTLNWGRLAWFQRLKDSSPSNTRTGWFRNLMHAPDFTRLPRTVIYTAGADPLRDEGEAYAHRLVECGNEVVLKRFLGVPHPFMHMDGVLPQAAEFISMTAREVRLAHHETSTTAERET